MRIHEVINFYNCNKICSVHKVDRPLFLLLMNLRRQCINSISLYYVAFLLFCLREYLACRLKLLQGYHIAVWLFVCLYATENEIKLTYNVRYIYLSVTVRGCKFQNLESDVTHLNRMRGFHSGTDDDSGSMGYYSIQTFVWNRSLWGDFCFLLQSSPIFLSGLPFRRRQKHFTKRSYPIYKSTNYDVP